MQDDKKLDTVLERFYNRFNKYNTKVLEILGNVIKQFDGLTVTQAHQLAQELRLGKDLYELENELAKISGKSIKDIDILFDKVAKENVEFSEVYFKAKNKEYVKYEDNEHLKDFVASVKKQAGETFTNLSQSNNTGFVLKDKQGNATYKPLADVYNNLIDEAVYNVAIGVQDYQNAMRNTIRGLADSGVKVHEEKVNYKNGYNVRIDSAVRQSVLTGLRQINMGVQEEIGERLDADGIEISAHSLCAEDHLSIQGKQYKTKKGETIEQLKERINNGLNRPIGTLNCRHFMFSIIYGVQEPNYSKDTLKDFRKESREKVKYGNKTYTKYEATQVQRGLETAIRKQKDRQIIARASGNTDEITKAQEKISILTKEYNNFSKNAGLDTYKNRLTVAGYHRLTSYDRK